MVLNVCILFQVAV